MYSGQDTFDGRSSVLQNGELYYKSDGTVDLRCSAVKNRSVLVRNDGQVDGRSEAVQNESLAIKPTADPANSERRNFTQAEIDYAWNKAQVVPGKNPDIYRADQLGNIIYLHSYGLNTDMGWDVDHSKPLKEGGTYHPNNLNAMQSDQNRNDKRANYPYDFKSEPVGVTREDTITTPIDKRCSGVVKGDLAVNYDGTIDRRSALVRQGEVLVTKDGNLDKRSAAYKQGVVTEKPSVQSVSSTAKQLSKMTLSSASPTPKQAPTPYSPPSSSSTRTAPLPPPSSPSYSSPSYSASATSSSSPSRAPSGGITVNGTSYKGGQFIPKSK